MELKKEHEKLLFEIHESENESFEISEIHKRGGKELQRLIEYLILLELVEYDKKDNAYYLTHEGYERVEEIKGDIYIADEELKNEYEYLKNERNKALGILIGLLFLIAGYFILNGVKTNNNLQEVLNKEVLENIQEEVVLQIDSILVNKDDIEIEEFYGFDTLLIREYISDDGNEISLEGSNSKDVYRITVESKKGNKKKFKIADNWYAASHSSILWDNNDYIFIHYGCGTNCKGGLVLSLNDNRDIIDYKGYIYVDSIRNLIVYPDSSNWNEIVIENFDRQDKIKAKLDLCEKSVILMDMIDSVFVHNNELIVIHESKDCQSKMLQKIKIEN